MLRAVDMVGKPPTQYDPGTAGGEPELMNLLADDIVTSVGELLQVLDAEMVVEK